ncbi:enolase C-terminal domain-like protein [Chloroflexota bacterium]
MKIKDLITEVYVREQVSVRVRRDMPPPPSKVYFTILKIITDEGIEGFAFGSEAIAKPAVKAIKPEIIGRDPLDREWIWQRLWYLYDFGRLMSFPLGAISAVDIALWDIAGKYFQVPVYKLMGAYRDKVPVYGSSWGQHSTQDYINEINACKEHGISAYKIHPYWRVGDKDIETCREVRKAVGNETILMLDPASHYNREEALLVGKELENLNFYWFEEPIPDHDIEGLCMLREKLRIPICATETVPLSMFSIPQYLTRRATDIVRCDTWLGGGITPCKKIADLCNAFGVQCEIHANWFPTCNIANLHVMGAVKNCEYYEMIWPERRYGLKEYPVFDNEGYIHVPENPGLGIDIDWETLGKPVETFK